ncbi:MAG: hypothetical protein EOR07_32920, partial [Mesorhizobium sp.]
SAEQGKTIAEATGEYARAAETLEWNGSHADELSAPIPLGPNRISGEFKKCAIYIRRSSPAERDYTLQLRHPPVRRGDSQTASTAFSMDRSPSPDFRQLPLCRVAGRERMPSATLYPSGGGRLA